MELTLAQAAIVGFIAVLIAEAAKFISKKMDKPIDRKVITIVVYVPAVLMAIYWAAPTMPVFPTLTDDPAVFVSVMLGYVGDLLVIAASVSGFAMTIYNLGMDKVLEKLGYKSID